MEERPHQRSFKASRHRTLQQVFTPHSVPLYLLPRQIFVATRHHMNTGSAVGNVIVDYSVSRQSQSLENTQPGNSTRNRCTKLEVSVHVSTIWDAAGRESKQNTAGTTPDPSTQGYCDQALARCCPCDGDALSTSGGAKAHTPRTMVRMDPTLDPTLELRLF